MMRGTGKSFRARIDAMLKASQGRSVIVYCHSQEECVTSARSVMEMCKAYGLGDVVARKGSLITFFKRDIHFTTVHAEPKEHGKPGLLKIYDNQ